MLAAPARRAAPASEVIVVVVYTIILINSQLKILFFNSRVRGEMNLVLSCVIISIMFIETVPHVISLSRLVPMLLSL